MTPAPLPAWHRDSLRELAELTLELARTTQRQALRQAEQNLAAHPPATTQACTAAGLLFTRLARALRQIVALDARLAEAETHTATHLAATAARRAAIARRRDAATLADIRRRLVRSIEADTTVRDTDDLFRDLDDRLADPDIDAALAERTAAELVLQLCHEFGITPNLADWPDSDLANLAPPPPFTDLTPSLRAQRSNPGATRTPVQHAATTQAAPSG